MCVCVSVITSELFDCLSGLAKPHCWDGGSVEDTGADDTAVKM